MKIAIINVFSNGSQSLAVFFIPILGQSNVKTLLIISVNVKTYICFATCPRLDVRISFKEGITVMAGQVRNITHVGQKYEINGKMTNVIPRSRIIALPLLTYDSPFNFLFQVKLSKRDSVHPSIKLQTFYFESVLA